MLHNTEFLEEPASVNSSFRRRILWSIHPEIDSTIKHQLISNSASQISPDINISASISSLKFFFLEQWINKFHRKDKRNSHEFLLELSSFYSGFFEKRHSKALLRKISSKLSTINSNSSLIYNTIYRPNIGTTDDRILQLIIITIITNIKDWTLWSASSIFQLFSFLVVCCGTISEGFGFVAFFASVKASSVCIHLSCKVCL